ncbi:hypothetical protein KSP40_PGU011863 [Platanthera guangdongensis]|uniref:Uncharacterized protein n=1 Tax=Platanthera guangdongensis TaxID=2320717 RepID=A0ABR2M1Q8_9ASPA
MRGNMMHGLQVDNAMDVGGFLDVDSMFISVASSWYLEPLSIALESESWSLVQPLLSSSYVGYGTSTLELGSPVHKASPHNEGPGKGPTTIFREIPTVGCLPIFDLGFPLWPRRYRRAPRTTSFLSDFCPGQMLGAVRVEALATDSHEDGLAYGEWSLARDERLALMIGEQVTSLKATRAGSTLRRAEKIMSSRLRVQFVNVKRFILLPVRIEESCSCRIVGDLTFLSVNPQASFPKRHETLLCLTFRVEEISFYSRREEEFIRTRERHAQLRHRLSFLLDILVDPHGGLGSITDGLHQVRVDARRVRIDAHRLPIDAVELDTQSSRATKNVIGYTCIIDCKMNMSHEVNRTVGDPFGEASTPIGRHVIKRRSALQKGPRTSEREQ